jgi:hypothetical protein
MPKLRGSGAGANCGVLVWFKTSHWAKITASDNGLGLSLLIINSYLLAHATLKF